MNGSSRRAGELLAGGGEMEGADPRLRRVRHLAPLTGYGQPQDREATARAGFDAHLVKPVEMAALADVLARLCGPPPVPRAGQSR